MEGDLKGDYYPLHGRHTHPAPPITHVCTYMQAHTYTDDRMHGHGHTNANANANGNGSHSYGPKPDGMPEEKEEELRKMGNLFQVSSTCPCKYLPEHATITISDI